MSVQGLEHETDVYKINNLPLFFFPSPRFGSKTDHGNNNNNYYYYILRRRARKKKETPCNYVYEVIEYR